MLHDDEIAAAVRGDVVDDDDVRVAEGRGGLGLLDEALPAVGVGHLVGGQDLDGDGPVEVGVLGLVDGAHAALADLFEDPVVEDRLAGQSGSFHFPRPPSSPYMSARARKVNPAVQARPRGRARGGADSSPDSPLGGIAASPTAHPE